MAEIVNPYIAGAPVTEQRMFFGREDVFAWIQNSLSGQYADHILVVHGQRRVGKTSVLKQLGNRLPKRYIPVFFDLQGRTHTTLDRFLWWLAREIVRVLKQERNIEAPLPDKEAFTADLEYFENRFLPDLKPALGNDTLLLTFDEFDNLEESEVREELARPLTDYLRRLMGSAGLNFIFSIGSSGRKLENMQAAYTEFFKTALYKKISFLSEEQTHNLVTRPVEGVLEYERGAVDRIYGIASGHPYFTQLTCHELFARCQRTEQRKIAKADVEAILDDVVERGTVNLKFIWDEATDIEKWSLAALAQLDKPDTRAVADYLRKSRVRFVESDLTSGLLHLREKDVLTPDNRFVIHLLKLWLQKNRPIEQAREELTEVNPIANRYIEIGLEFKDSGVYDKAIESFQQALAVAKDNVQAQVNIALTYMDQKAFSNAVVEFEKALTMDDEDVAARAGLCEAHLALGDAAMQRARAREAVQSYQRVLAINAEHTEARQRMAELSRQRAEKALVDGRDEEALSAFAEALKFTPEDPALIERVEKVRAEKKAKVLAALLARSEKEAGAKNWEAAVKSLEEASSLAPDDASIQKRMSAVKAAQEQARIDALLAKADAAAKSARWDEAMEAYGAALAAKPDETIAARLEDVRAKQREARLGELKTQARTSARAGRFDEALSAWEAYLALEPTDREQALAEIEGVKKAQALAKSYAEAQKAFAKKNYDQAVSLLKGIINQDENYKDASRLLAQAIELRRTARKWWQSKWLWGAVGSALVLIVAWFAFRPGSPLLSALFAPTAAPTSASTLNVAPATVAATAPPTATAAPLPYTWARLNSGQFLPRDTITAIVIDPNDSGVMYIGTQNAGVYKSIDGGVSWQPTHNGLGRAAIDSLIMDPHDSKILYAGTLLGGVYKTTNGGLAWQAMNEGIDSRNEWVTIIAMDAQNSQHLYFTDAASIYETKDGGLSWQLVKDGQGSCPHTFVGLALGPSDGNLYTADVGEEQSSCQGGVYKSINGGRSWSMLDLKWQIWDVWFNGLWIEPQKGQAIYVSSGGKLWVSSDDGATWTQSFDNYCSALVFDPQDVLSAYCASFNEILRTNNEGQQWTRLADNTSGWSSALAISPQGSGTLFLGASGLSMSSDGGKTWQEHGSGLGGSGVELKIFPANSAVLYAQRADQRIYLSDDSGRNWNEFASGRSLAFGDEGKIIYTLIGDDHLFSSTDSGKSWGQNALPLSSTIPYAVAAHPTNPDRVYVLYSRNTPPYIYYSDDRGVTWQATTGMRDVNNPRLFFDRDLGQRAYAVGDLEASLSDDGGVSWTNCGEFPARAWTSVSDARAAVDPRDSDRLFLATRGDGIIVSEDGCTNWQYSNSGLGSHFVNTVAIDPNDPDTIYAGTDGGAYVSFDSGQTWNQINDGLLGATVVYSIVVDKEGNVYAATPYGIFKLENK